MNGGLSTVKLYIFRRNCLNGCFYPLRDLQLEAPVDHCARCGGEIYRFDPVEWNEGPPVCPACRRAEEREREKRRKE